MIDKQNINESFFKTYLKDEVIGATDFNSLMPHDVQLIDVDYHQFMYGMLWSAKVNGKRHYFYVVFKIGSELANAFFESLIKEAIDKIVVWHKEEFPNELDVPMVDSIVFKCDKNKTDDTKSIN